MMKEQLIEELKEGEVRKGRVSSICDFGAFVDIGGADGLVHLSELSWSRVRHPSEVLRSGRRSMSTSSASTPRRRRSPSRSSAPRPSRGAGWPRSTKSASWWSAR